MSFAPGDDGGFTEQERAPIFGTTGRGILKRATTKRGYKTLGGEDDDELAEMGPMPVKRLPTKMVKKQIEIVDGRFVVNLPMPSLYLERVAHRSAEEFTHLRYTAAVAEPDTFAAKYALRQVQAGRKTKIAIVCTMYNEDDVLFAKTVSAIQDNIAYLCSGCPGWTEDAWKEVVVVIVSDGRAKVNQSTLDCLTAMGCYMDGLTRSSVNDEEVTNHVFEFTTQLKIDNELMFDWCDNEKDDAVYPMQTIFMLKEKNAKKINSHRWFFRSVCDQLKPNVCILLDIGTRPTRESIYHLYRAFERNPNVAGACGEIAADLGPGWVNLVNPIVAVQNFEYKMSNILDKPLESVFGYISVLPGAFSAYRYAALQGNPLEMYFKGEQPHGTNVSEANMYLAEDRILCFELVMKKKHQYILKYVKDARADTDVPAAFEDLIKQRRRWLNGSFFASLHSILNFHRIFMSGHNILRKFALVFQTIYNLVNLLFAWFGIGNFYISFYFLYNIVQTDALAQATGGTVSAAGQDPFYPYGGTVSGILRAMYLTSLLAILVASLGNRPEATRFLFITFAIFFAVIMGFMLFMGVWSIKVDIANYFDAHKYANVTLTSYLASDETFRGLVVSVLSTWLLYVISSVLYMDPWHAFTCMIQYLFMVPCFPNILMMYSFCNIHDVSWGTKGIEAAPLPGVKLSVGDDGKTMVTVDLPTAGDKDADDSYANILRKIEHEALKLDYRKPDQKPAKGVDDFFKQYRTTVVLAWLFSNFILVYILTNNWVASKMLAGGNRNLLKYLVPNGTKRRDWASGTPGGDGTDSLAKFVGMISVTGGTQGGNGYLYGLLWAVCGLSAIRFVFSMVYLIFYFLEKGTDKHTWQNMKRSRSASSAASAAKRKAATAGFDP
ncbi:chitin synthase-domain-containing protein [Chytriomyces sp. MP71]|nr:chitin synthase-domain-containing protein [Chytriomyces sp. MP71]